MSEEDSTNDKWSMKMESVKVDLKRAVIGGSVTFLIVLLGGWLMGEASASESYVLFKTAVPRALSYYGTILLALGNILALMLTLLSLSASLDIDIKWEHYQRVKQIALTVTATLIVTVVSYLLINIPVEESDKATSSWYLYIYYGTLISCSLIGGAFITIVLLLYNTVRDMIGVLNPETSHRLHESQEEEE